MVHQMTFSICLLPYGPVNCSHSAYQVKWCWAAWRALLYVSRAKLICFTDVLSYVWGNFIVSLTVFCGFCVPDDNLPWQEGWNSAQFSHASLTTHSLNHDPWWFPVEDVKSFKGYKGILQCLPLWPSDFNWNHENVMLVLQVKTTLRVCKSGLVLPWYYNISCRVFSWLLMF